MTNVLGRGKLKSMSADRFSVSACAVPLKEYFGLFVVSSASGPGIFLAATVRFFGVSFSHRLSVCLFLLFPSVCLCIFLSVRLRLSLSPCLSVSVFAPLPLSLCFSVRAFLSLHLCLCDCVSVSACAVPLKEHFGLFVVSSASGPGTFSAGTVRCFVLPPSVFLSVSFCFLLSVCVSFCLFVFVCFCLHVFVSLSPCISVCLCLYPPPLSSFVLFLCACLLVSVSLSL